ncbi:hypothetical protein [Pseudomonas fluorescens]|uniref:Uncharacterized protein n=1 Tax=Pseudomonas fluorescens TaxID=294 RepID=A0A5E7ADC0_PSEFL|nr:hypothetical protein [Pseudomonas fluorescens]VVN73971.1 hypothetical protein PS710_00619 [Pseudomonas fluorescens]
MKPVVTEQTAKRYKGRMLIGGLLCCIGVVAMIGSENPLPGIGMLFAGLVVYLSARFFRLVESRLIGISFKGPLRRVFFRPENTNGLEITGHANS